VAWQLNLYCFVKLVGAVTVFRVRFYLLPSTNINIEEFGLSEKHFRIIQGRKSILTDVGGPFVQKKGVLMARERFERSTNEPESAVTKMERTVP
jgi:hypothetical protein